MWSDTATESNPASSHARARRFQCTGGAPIMPWQNFMRGALRSDRRPPGG